MGRPRKYSDEEVAEIATNFKEYISETAVPIIAEFAYQADVPRETLYKYDEFSTLIKECIDKKEAALERLALDGRVNTTMAIFSLKQLGWRDKHDVEHSGAINMVFDSALKDV